MPTYDVFLSHAGDDKPAVEALARRLRDEEGLRVFFDRWQLVPGTPWQEALEQALADSRTCAVFVGPEGLGPWHGVEMRAALGQRQAEAPKRVIPVLLPGASKDAVPGFLAQRTWVDFRGGLDDETAYARLVAGIRGEAPGGEGVEPPVVEPPPGELPGGDAAEEVPVWWRLIWPQRATALGLSVGILGAVLTTLAWLWPRPPNGPGPSPAPEPAIYSLRVQVLDPDGHPVRGSTVKASAGNEPHRLPDGWSQVDIPAAKVPLDGKVTIWAELPPWEPGRVEVELGADANPAVEVRLKAPETPASRLGGIVVDAATRRGVAGARVTVRDHPGDAAETDQDGKFELAVEATKGKRVRLNVDHPDFPPEDAFCYAGSFTCSVTLKSP